MKNVLAVSVAVIVVALVLSVGCGPEQSAVTVQPVAAQQETQPAQEQAQPVEKETAEAAADETKKPAEQEDPYPEATAAGIKTKEQRVSYAIGYDIGTNFRRQDIAGDMDMDVFMRGIRAGIADAEEPLTKAQLRDVLIAFNDELRVKLAEKHRMLAEKNKKAGEEFLAENAKKEGVIVRESGVQYKILELGTGPKPNDSDVVTVEYRGMLIDGTEFDSSYKRGKPATLPLPRFIPGWSEAVAQLPVGTKAMIYIPGELAYGERGTASIEPNSTLIFEVTLLAAEPQPEKPKPTPRPRAQTRPVQPRKVTPKTDATPEGNATPSPDAKPEGETGDAAKPAGN
ncbi:MAG: FKBP-type peptidyl-prolyl cis-trans isomerase [Planctomycetes bacterium]|nr:FKBP-type peptidyl-prolyl cis-trans isomerase [Planctomycetota bacterium]